MRVVCFDLDDTLYKEIDYLKSAYREIATYATRLCPKTNLPTKILEHKVYEVMLNAYRDGRNAFETLNAYLGLDLPISVFLQIYREHKPAIFLDTDTYIALNRLRSEGTIIGIVTDGREETQLNKIRALGLTEWINEKCVIINSSPGSFKPNPFGYKRFEMVVQTLYKASEYSFSYIGDNLKKDFIWPKKNGWQTICLKDNGRNIHYQDFKNTPKEALPDLIIRTINEV